MDRYTTPNNPIFFHKFECLIIDNYSNQTGVPGQGTPVLFFIHCNRTVFHHKPDISPRLHKP